MTDQQDFAPSSLPPINTSIDSLHLKVKKRRAMSSHMQQHPYEDIEERMEPQHSSQNACWHYIQYMSLWIAQFVYRFQRLSRPSKILLVVTVCVYVFCCNSQGIESFEMTLDMDSFSSLFGSLLTHNPSLVIFSFIYT
jgi:hypothetical protein